MNTNEESVKGTSPVQENPGHAEAGGTLNATWGQDPTKEPVQNSTAVKQEAEKDRAGLLTELLDSMKEAPTAKAVMNQYFAHASEGQAHTPLLKKSSDETLTDQIMRVVGHR